MSAATATPKKSAVVRTSKPKTVQVHKVEEKKGKVKVYKIDPLVRLKSGKVDQIRLIDNLKPIREKLANEVKDEMLANGAKFVDGDIAFGQVSQATSNNEIDVKKFFKLYKSGKIKEADFLDCITVGKAPAKKLLGEKTLATILTPLDPSQPTLTVNAIPEATPVKLTDVIERLAPVVSQYELELQAANEKAEAAE